MTSIRIHPSELSYAFSYSQTVDVIGWGRDPFLPGSDADGDPKAWYANGAARLKAAGRLVGSSDDDLDFTEEMTAAVLALSDPALVLMAERKEGEGLRRLTVHAAKGTVLGMSHSADGMFELTFYADLTAAALACVGFLGVARLPAQAGAHIESDLETMSGIRKLATAGKADAAITSLGGQGATAKDAASIAEALAAPVASGMLSLIYCSDNIGRNVQPYSVFTNANEESWVMFSPGRATGPMIVEQSSIPALTGRVMVEIATWQKVMESQAASEKA